MSWIAKIRDGLNTPAIPGIPGSTVGDLFGIGAGLGIPSLGDTVASTADQLKTFTGVASGAVSTITENLPIIVGGAFIIIILLKT